MLLLLLVILCYCLRKKAIFYVGNLRHALSEAGCICWEPEEERYSCHDRYNVPLVSSRASSRRSSTRSRTTGGGTARRNTSFSAKYKPGEDGRSLKRHFEYLNTAPRGSDTAKARHAKQAADAADSAAAAAAAAATRAANGAPARPPVIFTRLCSINRFLGTENPSNFEMFGFELLIRN